MHYDNNSDNIPKELIVKAEAYHGKETKISIGMPFRNPGRWFLRAIKSVFSQSWENWELLLVDDGSTDGSVEIAKSIRDERVILIQNNESKGLATRLNQIARMAKGKYIARMDSDDIMHPDRLAYQLFAIINKDEKKTVIGSYAYSIDHEDNIYGIHTVREKISKWKSRHLFIHPSIFASRDWFLSNPYSEHVDFQRCQDAELWTRTHDEIIAINIKTPLLYYREFGVFSISNYRGTAVGLHRIIKDSNMSRIAKIIRHLRVSVSVKIYEVANSLNFANYLIYLRAKRSTSRDREEAIIGLKRALATSVPGIDK